jgi:hypothetical protein
VIYEANLEDANELHIGSYISIINDGDPVPRIERAYILSLADLYGTQGVSSNADAEVPSWEPPASPQLHVPRLSNILTIHVLQEDEHGMEVKICQTSRGVLEKTIALDFERHKMKWYLTQLDAWAGKI